MADLAYPQLLAEAQQQTNGWDALVIVALFALFAFVAWLVFRD